MTRSFHEIESPFEPGRFSTGTTDLVIDSSGYYT
jgi:hypothetical protein